MSLWHHNNRTMADIELDDFPPPWLPGVVPNEACTAAPPPRGAWHVGAPDAEQEHRSSLPEECGDRRELVDLQIRVEIAPREHGLGPRVIGPVLEAEAALEASTRANTSRASVAPSSAGCRDGAASSIPVR